MPADERRESGRSLGPSPRVIACFFAFVPAFLAGGTVLALTSDGPPEAPPSALAALETPGSPGPGSESRRFVTGGRVPPMTTTASLRPLERRPKRPATLSIPSSGITAWIVRVGAAEDGIRVPQPTDVGWYRQGPRPGEVGRAIVIGHLDSAEGPAAFTGLPSTEIGSRIEIVDRGGETHAYEASKVIDVAKSEFPADRIYESRGTAELVLITCGGEFDPETGYEDNLIVVAKATSTR